MRNSVPPRSSGESRRVRGGVPLPVVPGFSLDGRGLGLEIKNPASDETAQNGNIGDDDGNVVLDVIDTVIDGISPVRLLNTVETVAIGKIDFGGANSGNTVANVSEKVAS